MSAQDTILHNEFEIYTFKLLSNIPGVEELDKCETQVDNNCTSTYNRFYKDESYELLDWYKWLDFFCRDLEWGGAYNGILIENQLRGNRVLLEIGGTVTFREQSEVM